jgi:hypothetical protein
MLQKTLILSCTLLLISCNVNSANDKSKSTQNDLVDVYIKKGNTQCNDDGMSLNEASSYLSNADIKISKSTCGVITGIVFPSMCGAGTDNIYYFSIDKTALPQAEKLGFIPLSTLDSGLGYKAAACM